MALSNEAFGRRVNTIRKQHGYSLAQFSERAGIARSTLHEIEHGAATPHERTVQRIAHALAVDPDYLRNGAGGSASEVVDLYSQLPPGLRANWVQIGVMLMHAARNAAHLDDDA